MTVVSGGDRTDEIRAEVFELIADRLGEHKHAHNISDYTDERTTVITLRSEGVEELAEWIAPPIAALVESLLYPKESLQTARHEIRFRGTLISRGDTVSVDHHDKIVAEAQQQILRLEGHTESLRARVEAAEAKVEQALPLLALFTPWNVSPGQIDNLARVLGARAAEEGKTS